MIDELGDDEFSQEDAIKFARKLKQVLQLSFLF